MKLSKILKLKLPEKNGKDAANIEEINMNFKTLEEATQTFDALADKYGYSYAKTTPNGVSTHTFTVASGCPVTATKVVKEGQSGSNKVYTFTITVDGVTVNKTMTAGKSTAEMVVG